MGCAMPEVCPAMSSSTLHSRPPGLPKGAAPCASPPPRFAPFHPGRPSVFHFGASSVIDLSRAADASTAAFAHLIVLRTTLLARSSDLKLAGLRDRAAKVHEVNRLHDVLPRAT